MFKSTPLRFFLLQVLISSSSSSFSRRIVGGFPVEISRCPYQVSVQDVERNEHFCGGSIIGNLWVVSAGHCFEPEILPSNYYIRAGSTRHKVGGVTVAAKKIILHEDYHKENYALYNDISLIMLDSPLTFNTYIQPILLPDSDATPKQGIAGIVSGWGSLKDGENEPLSDNLMAAKIYVIEKSECQEVFKLLNVNLTDGLICAGTARSKRGV